MPLASSFRAVDARGDADRLPPLTSLMFVASFAMLIIAGIASIVMSLRVAEADRLVLETIETQAVADDVFTAIQDAETGQRGFLLTANTRFLQPYERSQIELPAAVAILRDRLAGDPDQQKLIGSLTLLLNARMEHLRNGIEAVQQGRVSEARDPERLAQGKEMMDRVRQHLGDLASGKRTLLSEYQARAASLRDWLVALIALSLSAAAVMALIVKRTIQHYISRLHTRSSELETEIKRRLETEDTLRQAQKMEAIGQLTGGLAHDFNNLLTIVIGNLDTLRRRLANVSPGEDASHFGKTLAKPVELAMQGSRSAAQVTHRLLAFSRRQALEPRNIDLNRLVGGMSELLHRTLGENVAVETVLAGGLWPTFADANQVENALLNLVVNARDAMPDGGKLTIETANTYLDENYSRRFGDVAPGQYALLSVTDTGTGIPPSLIEKIFEPFFTTKDTGHGSGLGLAMVHGFVKQSGGHLRVYSEEGQGTTVKIYLPRNTDAETMHSHPPAGETDLEPLPRARPNETLLVVEDNEGVREYAVSILEDLGYSVIEASDVKNALEKVETAPQISLLFTDVVLPGGASGRDLMRHMVKRYPGLPVLFTTGYTRNAIVHGGRLDANVHLLNKPYTQQELARKLRELLDRTKQRRT